MIKGGCSGSKRASGTRLGCCVIPHHSGGAPVNSPGITNCPGITFWSLPSLTMSFKKCLLGTAGRKARVMVGTAGITILFHGLGADGAPKPVRSLETCHCWVLSVKGWEETWKTHDTFLSAIFHSSTPWWSSPTHFHQLQTLYQLLRHVQTNLLGQPQPEKEEEALKTHTHP